MKRGPGGLESAPSGGPGAEKRPRGDRYEARLLIPSKVAGSIIGKGGANIQKLRSDNNANVRVPDCPGPERVMTIQSDSVSTILKVVEASIPLMSEEAASAPPGTAPPTSGGAQEIRVLIHQSIVGGIIGRAGFKIKEIRDQSGANIKVYQTCAPQSSDRCVAVLGAGDKIVEALKMIFDVVEATEIKGPDQPYDPANFDGFYAHEYGGYGSEGDVMGYGGGGMRGGRAGGGGVARGGSYGGSGGSNGFGFNRGGGGGGRGYGGQDFRGGFQGGRGGNGFQGGFGRGRYPEPENYFGQFTSAGGGGDDGAGGDGGEHESTQVTIPKDMAGAIIGPGGSRIRKIRSDSKATITIDEPLPGSQERIITITGNERSIQTAQYLLQQSVRDHSSGPPSGRY